MLSKLQPFTSAAGRRLFLDSAKSDTLRAYYPLPSHRGPQGEASLQGVSTLAVILNALGVDPRRVWKWPWRWYSEPMLSSTAPTTSSYYAAAGAAAAAAAPSLGSCATLEEFSALAASQGVHATVHYAAEGSAVSEEALRSAARSTSTDPMGGRQFAVAAYARHAIANDAQDGKGGLSSASCSSVSHFSLVVGFHSGEDAVMLADVHPARSVPSWVSVAALHGAMVNLHRSSAPAPEGKLLGGFVLVARTH
jgi:glutathione gamma-glutamylcysteinyltransferase